MSVSKLSKVAQRKILEGLIANVAKEINQAKETNPTLRGSSAPIAVSSGNATRILSNLNQTGIVGVSGLQALAEGFRKISQDASKVGSRVITKKGEISKAAGYSALKQYLRDQLKNSDNEFDTLQATVRDLGKKADKVLSNPSLYNDFLTFVEGKQLSLKKQEKLFTIENIEHGQLNKLFAQFLTDSKKVETYLVEFISANIDAGHLLGIFNQKLFRYFGATAEGEYSLGELNVDIFKNIEYNAEEDSAAIQEVNAKFSAAFNLLEYIDFLSSLIQSSPDVFVVLSKEVYKGDTPTAATEMQISIDNSEVGTLIASAGRRLESLIKSTTKVSVETLPGSTQQVKNPQSIKFAQQIEDLFKDIGKIAEKAKSMAEILRAADDAVVKEYGERIAKKSQQFGTILLNAEGSDSVKKAIAVNIKSIIGGTKLPAASSSTATADSIAKKPKGKTSKTVVVPKIAISKQNKKDISVTSKVTRASFKPNVGINLTSLLSIISSALNQKIRENMGDGSRRDILNYRTGRFAETVKVERLSQSRQGMITAFYSYMKNPYATFSEGGRQEFPRSRDPKLLISKSIRELVTNQVANKLRAVSV